MKDPRRITCAAKTALIILLLACLTAIACEPLEEQGDDSDVDLDDDDDDNDDPGDDDDDDDGWTYPYHLVIGGGLSETLDLVTIEGRGEAGIQNDVRPTASAINQTLVYRDELYAVCSLSHSVIVYDLDHLDLEREFSLGVGSNPMTLAFHRDFRAYVSNYVTNDVTLYDLDPDFAGAERLLAAIPMPGEGELPADNPGEPAWARPGGVVVLGDQVYVSLSNLQGRHMAAGPGVIVVIDALTNQITDSIETVGRDLIALWHDAPGGVLFSTAAGDWQEGQGFIGNGGVDVLDLDTGVLVDYIDTGGTPFEMTVCPNRRAYLGNGKEAIVLSFDADTGEILPSINIKEPDDPLGLSYASALVCDGNNVLYAADFNHDVLFIIDTQDGNRILEQLETNDGPDTLSLIYRP